MLGVSVVRRGSGAFSFTGTDSVFGAFCAAGRAACFFCSASESDNRFRLFLELDAETNNCVLVEFGVDADSSGALERGEVEFSVGWDCGEWVLRDHRGGCAAAVGGSAGRRRLEWTLWLRPDKTARRLFAEDDGVVFDGAVPSTFYSPEWSIARVVRRGPEPSACVSYDMSVFPLTIKLR